MGIEYRYLIPVFNLQEYPYGYSMAYNSGTSSNLWGEALLSAYYS